MPSNPVEHLPGLQSPWLMVSSPITVPHISLGVIEQYFLKEVFKSVGMFSGSTALQMFNHLEWKNREWPCEDSVTSTIYEAVLVEVWTLMFTNLSEASFLPYPGVPEPRGGSHCDISHSDSLAKIFTRYSCEWGLIGTSTNIPETKAYIHACKCCILWNRLCVSQSALIQLFCV